VAMEEEAATTIEAGALEELLGPAKFVSEVAGRVSEPGVAAGLAWTPAGGEIIFVEATCFPGKGQLILTGHIVTVMKESVQAALSLIRSRCEDLGIDPRRFGKLDIHVHVPAGAVPKDGPSAGVAMATALASLMLSRPVRAEVAMTGEITLRGLVLPVGGVKEKVLAARQAGIKTVVLPERNRRHLEDVPADVRRELRFVFAETVDDVLKAALGPARGQPKRPSTTRKNARKKR